jgi:hypothetical protein
MNFLLFIERRFGGISEKTVHRFPRSKGHLRVAFLVVGVVVPVAQCFCATAIDQHALEIERCRPHDML